MAKGSIKGIIHGCQRCSAIEMRYKRYHYGCSQCSAAEREYKRYNNGSSRCSATEREHKTSHTGAAGNALPSQRSIKGITYGCSLCSADEREYKKYHTRFLAMLCHVRREYKRSGITATSSDENKKIFEVCFYVIGLYLDCRGHAGC